MAMLEIQVLSHNEMAFKYNVRMFNWERSEFKEHTKCSK